MANWPPELQRAAEALAEAYGRDALTRDARAISAAYRERTGHGERLLTREGEAAAYAAARMPATYGAASAALEQALAASGLAPRTLLDCGAGTGAMSFAADAQLSLAQVTCVEREAAMRSIGQRLMQEAGSPALAGAVWAACDLAADDPLPRAELVCEGYMLGELPQALRLPVASKLWQAAEQMLLLVEPGTPQGFANLRAVRTMLLEAGAYIAAPCPEGTRDCPMAEADWCHFVVRVPRTRLHKALKAGDAPYEDEKFAYLAATRTLPAAPCAARVLRHPQVASGRITLTLCGGGRAYARVVTKKDPLWKRARKAEAGEGIPLQAAERGRP